MEEQFGFRKYRSTTDHLTRVINMISNRRKTKINTGMAILDIEKAFDKVIHGKLITTLKQRNIPIQLINIINEYLKDRTFQVKVNEDKSENCKQNGGVPQRSALGPQLFNIYINQMPSPTGHRIKRTLYADDIAILVQSRDPRIISRKLEEDLTKIMEELGLKINTEKIQLILFSDRSKKKINNKFTIKINNKIINATTTATYLGVELDKN